MFAERTVDQVAIVEPQIATLDERHGRALVAAIRDLIRPDARIVLNLRNVTYINSAALGYITTTCRRVQHHRGRLAVCCLQERPLSVLRFTHLDQLLDGIFDTEPAAIMALQNPATVDSSQPAQLARPRD